MNPSVEKVKARLAMRLQARFAKLKASWRAYSAPITASYLLLTALYVVQAVASSKLYATIIYAVGSFLYLVIAVLHWFAESGVEGELEDLTHRVGVLEERAAAAGGGGSQPATTTIPAASQPRYSFAAETLRARVRNV